MQPSSDFHHSDTCFFQRTALAELLLEVFTPGEITDERIQ